MTFLHRALAATAALALPLGLAGAMAFASTGGVDGLHATQADGGVRINQVPIVPDDREL